ncbi:hypothetical protein BJX76DRAFT_356479 [Aspergillus varians]
MIFQPGFILVGLAAITTALATPTKATWEPTLVQRDGAAIVSSIIEINHRIIALGEDIAAYTGGDTSAIHETSTKLVAAINAGTDIVLASRTLTTTEALNLALIVEAGSGPSVYAQLQGQLVAANGFAEALSSKVPAGLKDVAEELSAGITGSIQKGINAYVDASATLPETTATPPPIGTSTTSAPHETETETTSTSATTSEPHETETETEIPEPAPTPSGMKTKTSSPSTSEPYNTETETNPASTAEPSATNTETPHPSTTDQPQPTKTSTQTRTKYPAPPPEQTSTGPGLVNPPEPTEPTSIVPKGVSPEPTGGGQTVPEPVSPTSPNTPEFTGGAAATTFESSLAGAMILGAVAMVL